MSRPTQDHQIRIDEILDTAEPLFNAKGYRKTTISDIAKKMGTAKGMLYYYFNSKEEILEALINRQISQVLINIENLTYSNNITPPHKIELMVTEMFRATEYRDHLLLDLLYDENNLNIKNKVVQHITFFVKPLLLKIIKEGNQKKCFQVSYPQIAVHFINSILLCIVDTLSEKLPDELMVCHWRLAEALIEQILSMPKNTLHFLD